MTSRIALVSCVKTKQESAAAAEDLYTSTWFRYCRRYAEQNADRWFILSAEHGVLRPEQRIDPYERALMTMSKQARIAWAGRVQQQLLELLPASAVVIVLAGIRYRENVAPFLEERGFTITVPMLGKRSGQQLQWLKEQTRDDPLPH